jgi:hypothetical protein|tara:strand:+ start:595 stop:798 length:204 start_codon:yes stop_codon:yes gene_type:complete
MAVLQAARTGVGSLQRHPDPGEEDTPDWYALGREHENRLMAHSNNLANLIRARLAALALHPTEKGGQ